MTRFDKLPDGYSPFDGDFDQERDTNHATRQALARIARHESEQAETSELPESTEE